MESKTSYHLKMGKNYLLESNTCNDGLKIFTTTNLQEAKALDYDDACNLKTELGGQIVERTIKYRTIGE